MAVVFAMLASYGLSRTLTPIMIGLLIRKEHEPHGEATGSFAQFHGAFNAKFDQFRDFYGYLLAGILRRRILTPTIALLIVIGAGVLSLNIGSDFFPSVDAGLIQLHVRAPARTRIERTEQIFQAIEDNIRAHVAAKDLKLVLDNIGLPAALQSRLHRWQHHWGQ
jgi:multidrug efflux pump subunit AcrB